MTPEPTSRSAQARSRQEVKDAGDAESQDPLDHLPPLDLPGEVTRSAATPPAPPAAQRTATSAETANKKVDVRREAPAPSADDLDLTSATVPASGPSPSSSVGPGIGRFVAVDLKLAGGSAPSADGLKWLAEKGYRTILDLRESAEVPPAFIADVTGMGLRYVALPIGLGKIDRDHVDRFNFEMAAGEARPLFFFDSDGTRAGALWYIRRIASDRVDDSIARREAQEIGLTDSRYWQAATNYIDRLGGPRTTATPRPAGAVANGGQKPVDAREQRAVAPAAKPEETSQSAPTPAGASPARPAVTANPPARQPAATPTAVPAAPSMSESLAWRPFAAMVLTGLSLPLAYWSRTLPPILISKARASLPGPVQRPKSLPVELDA